MCRRVKGMETAQRIKLLLVKMYIIQTLYIKVLEADMDAKCS